MTGASPASVRPAEARDLDACARILGDWVRETGWHPVLHDRAEDRGFLGHLHATTTLLVTGDPAKGFLALEKDEIEALYLAPGARGQGRGTALLAEAQRLRSRLRLWTFAANAAARAFYARHGFVEIDATDGAANEARLPDIRLEWTAP